MEWEYGKMMVQQGDLKSLDNWSDDKEIASKIMDRELDYLWWYENGIHYKDRLLDSEKDEKLEKRIQNNEAELHFDNFENVFRWILSKIKDDNPYYDWIVARVSAGDKTNG